MFKADNIEALHAFKNDEGVIKGGIVCMCVYGFCGIYNC